MNNQILLVDDDLSLVEIITSYLTNEGYQVDSCHDGETAITMVTQKNYDIILLDIMLPTISGLHVLKVLKPQINVPIILLTAKDGVSDEILGLETGAFDYICKPFDLKILCARVRSAISSFSSSQKIESDLLTFEELTIFQDEKKVVLNNVNLSLTKSEYKILVELTKHISVLLSKEYLHGVISNKPMSTYDRSIDTHIKNLRKKIKSTDMKKGFSIKTVYGHGYILKYDDE